MFGGYLESLVICILFFCYGGRRYYVFVEVVFFVMCGIDYELKKFCLEYSCFFSRGLFFSVEWVFFIVGLLLSFLFCLSK